MSDRGLLVRNGTVFRQGAFRQETVHVIGRRFASAAEFAAARGRLDVDEVDAAGRLVLPALTDIHLHGAGGHDISDADPDGIAAILRYEASVGVGQIVPATLTVSKEQLEAVFAAIGTVYADGRVGDGAFLAGLHMEGPYISAAKLGAQNPVYVRAASLDEFRRLNALAGGAVKIVSLAPETKGAMAFIEAVSAAAIVSLAHTTADYETAAAAFAAGASHVTHLYNAMPPFHHRDPGVIGAVADCPHASVELIADGVHIHPSVIRATFRMFPGRVVLISDSMRATGLGDGVYDLGGQPVTVTGSRAVIENVSIAGSVTNLFDCLRYAVAAGIQLEAAVFAASEYPAARIGIDGEAGTILPGRRANFLLTDESLNLETVFINGKALR